MTSQIHIGTSGWHYPHWSGAFYPAGLSPRDFFGYYAARFSSVEINNSFYRMPRPETLAGWREAAPAGFVFAVKASRYITHVKKLKDPEKGVKNFLGVIGALEDKLGPVLFQLPPGWSCNSERLKAFLGYLPSAYRYAFEFRNAGWFAPEVLDLLRRHNCAFCIYELDRHLSPRDVTAGFVYIRLHGPGRAYQGSYDHKTLAGWARAIRAWQQEGRDVYCYFDNDQAGYAAQNAGALKRMLTT